MKMQFFRNMLLQVSGRELNAVYQEKLVMKTVLHYGSKLFLPMPIRAVITSVKSVKYIWHGIRCLMHGKIEVPVLDATAISVSVFRRDICYSWFCHVPAWNW